MKLLTQVHITPLKEKISHQSKIFSLGSCFAQNIAAYLQRYKFHITPSPTGILFNPESVASAIKSMSQITLPLEQELILSQGRWCSYDFHSSVCATSKSQAIALMKDATKLGQRELNASDTVIITFGSAWVYRLKSNNRIVANCHKQPQALFTRECLGVEDIVNLWSPILKNELQGKQVIFTLSPIRHLSDGMEQNSLSKATLRVAIAKLQSAFDNVAYFPSYEIMMDELRDYRFYADDMLHPSHLAIEYIWQRFAECTICEQSQKLIERIDKIMQAAEHRPFNPQSDAHREFCSRQLAEIAALEQQYTALDFENEKNKFLSYL